MSTVNMTLSLPTVSVTAGPTYATMVNTAFDAIDAHDHTTGKGVQIPSSGLNINAALPFNDNGAYELLYAGFSNTTVTSAINKSLYVNAGNELCYRNSSGAEVAITSGSAVAIPSGTGAISYAAVSSSPYSVAYTADYSKLLGVDTTTAKTLLLPAASSGDFAFSVKDISGLAATNNITITPNSGDSIESGAVDASFVINENYGSRTFVADTASQKWHII